MPGAEAVRPTLARVADALAQAGVAYSLTGGLVSSFYGDPRFTQDVDIVLPGDVSHGQLALLKAVLGPSFFLDMGEALAAAGSRSLFTALDQTTNIKVDFHVGESVPGELARARRLELVPGLVVHMCCVEDLILAKLLWIAKGSHKSRHDVASMLRRHKEIDTDALTRKAELLGVAVLLEELRREAEGHSAV